MNHRRTSWKLTLIVVGVATSVAAEWPPLSSAGAEDREALTHTLQQPGSFLLFSHSPERTAAPVGVSYQYASPPQPHVEQLPQIPLPGQDVSDGTQAPPPYDPAYDHSGTGGGHVCNEECFGVGPHAGWNVPIGTPASVLGPEFGTSTASPRRWRVTPLFGIMWGDEPLTGQVQQRQGLFGGFRVGTALAESWRLETRLAMATLRTRDPQEGRRLPDADVFLWDVDVVFSPWDGGVLTPYMWAGLGLANFAFTDAQNQPREESLFGIPAGLGLEHHLGRQIVLRLEVADNLAMAGSGLETMHNFTLSAAVEIGFRRRGKSYWPWDTR